MSWPVVEQKYGTYGYLLREVGGVLGYGRNQDAWSREKRGIADAVVQRGLMAFYTPVPLPEEKYSHEWSFLRPLRQLTTVASTYKYELPADFVAIDGPITYTPDQSTLYQPVAVVSEYEVRRRQQDTSTTGRPTIAALVPSAATPGRTEIWFWTTPDDAYVMEFRCQINPLELSENNPVPHGGIEHAHTILESCMAAAEEEKGVRGGLHSAQFAARLLASVSADRKKMCPRTLGRNLVYDQALDRRELDLDVTTYDSTEWD